MKNNIYIPTTEQDVQDMLAKIGVKEIDELYDAIPKDLKLDKELALPSPIKEKLPLSEMELKDYMGKLSAKDASSQTHKYFLGAGCYNHHVPSIVDLFMTLPQFLTPYTPYKPEANQGSLQAMHEYQSLMCRLTGLDVSNASLYDGATAMMESAKMAARLTDRKEIIISKAIHPEYRQVFETYFKYGEDWKVREIGIKDGKTDAAELKSKISEDTAAVIIQNPNFFGMFEGMEDVSDLAHDKGALYISHVCEALSLALVKPADFGADIVSGEAQSFGSHMSYGGPHLGFINCFNKHKSRLPGRIVTKGTDIEGETAYILWGSGREQHISRDKATSNICSNHALNALAAAIYLTSYGKQGLQELADVHNMQMAHYARDKISAIDGYKQSFPGDMFFNEFAMDCPHDVSKLNENLLEHKVVGGLDLGKFYPEYKNKALFCVTEKTSKDDIDNLADLLKHYKAKGVQ